MRNKIIIVNAIIIAIVGLLSFVLVRSSVTAAASPTTQLMGDAKHDAQSAAARLQLDGLRVERWLATKAEEQNTRDALNSKADPRSGGPAATSLCDSVIASAKTTPEFEGAVPAIVLLVDRDGKILGRNNSNLLRGESLAAAYPKFTETMLAGKTGSDVWVNAGRNDQYLASYAPARNDKGEIVGAIVAGFTINDVMSRVADATTGRPMVLASVSGDNLQVIARSSANTGPLDSAVTGDGKATVRGVLDTGHAAAASASDLLIAAAPLDGLSNPRGTVVVVSSPATTIENAAGIASPLLGVAVLGIILVVVGGFLLGNYITHPIGQLEEGLLAILNGQSDKRFNLDHAELGGLAFRIDQLLNQLMGVEEDTTDEQGRVSRTPSPAQFQEEAGSSPNMVGDAARLGAEPAAAYYSRLFAEYIAAKKGLGEQTDHITEQTFTARIQSMEADAKQKQGTAVRYQVQTQGTEVTLLPVTLS